MNKATVSCGKLQSETACDCNLRTIATAGEGMESYVVLRKIATYVGGTTQRHKTYSLRNWQLKNKQGITTILRRKNNAGQR